MATTECIYSGGGGANNAFWFGTDLNTGNFEWNYDADVVFVQSASGDYVQSFLFDTSDNSHCWRLVHVGNNFQWEYFPSSSGLTFSITKRSLNITGNIGSQYRIRTVIPLVGVSYPASIPSIQNA